MELATTLSVQSPVCCRAYFGDKRKWREVEEEDETHTHSIRRAGLAGVRADTGHDVGVQPGGKRPATIVLQILATLAPSRNRPCVFQMMIVRDFPGVLFFDVEAMFLSDKNQGSAAIPFPE